jgi:hypothetical protein
MRYSIVLFFAILFSLVSCRKDFDTVPSTGKLEFSKKTVYLDTVFTNIGSSTYMLKVYNRSSDDITIPSIALAKGNASRYRLMVDGKTGVDIDNNGVGNGKIFQNVEVLANDSLFVYIETTVNIAEANTTDMLYTDEILFDSGAYQQKVNLVTLIQDAIFLYPERYPDGNNGYVYEGLQLVDSDPTSKIYGFELNENDPINGNELHFTKTKPYVIYGYAGVPATKTLIIDKGARIHFHDLSGIFVKKGGSIQINGEISTDMKKLENEVIFEGDRLEPDFAEVAGQWGIIYLAPGSTNNIINHATIKNATVGIFVDIQDATTTTTQIKNTQIYNTSNYGIVARNGKINGENIVINKAGKSSLACIYGGSYDFIHCTFANYWQGSTRQTPTVYLDNTYKQDNTLFITNLVKANFTNCIIYGPNNIEIGLNNDNSASFNFNIKNTLIKFNDVNNLFTSSLYDFVKKPNTFNNIIGNGDNANDPRFKEASKNNLRIKFDSPAKAKGDPVFTIAQDADGKTRTSPPDLGAYEHLAQ